MIRQALDSARLASEDEAVHERILREALVAASELDLRQPPPAMAQRVHRRIRELTGKDDPYREAKERQNRMALEFYERFSHEVARAGNELEMAVRLAIAGNVIDLGVKSDLDESQIREAIETCLTEPLDGDIHQFAAAIDGATRILYLTDNAGEIVLDRLLIEQLPRDKVTVAVKGAPVINDATWTDAETAGITGLVTVIDNGSDAPGTILEDCSGVFRRHFAEADLIIAKGQGNYETLREVPRPLYFLLRVKCPVIARDLGCPVGRMVLRPSSSLPQSIRTSTGCASDSIIRSQGANHENRRYGHAVLGRGRRFAVCTLFLFRFCGFRDRDVRGAGKHRARPIAAPESRPLRCSHRDKPEWSDGQLRAERVSDVVGRRHSRRSGMCGHRPRGHRAIRGGTTSAGQQPRLAADFATDGEPPPQSMPPPGGRTAGAARAEHGRRTRHGSGSRHGRRSGHGRRPRDGPWARHGWWSRDGRRTRDGPRGKRHGPRGWTRGTKMKPPR